MGEVASPYFILAGANQRSSGAGEDGILTAAEIAKPTRELMVATPGCNMGKAVAKPCATSN